MPHLDLSNPRSKILAGTAATLLVAAVTIWFLRPATIEKSRTPTQAFFSTDDGASWFAANGSEISPFMHDGKPAYRVYVFTNDGGKTAWVGHMERFNQETLAAIKERGLNDPKVQLMVMHERPTRVEVKRPGDAKWVKVGDPKGAAITMEHGPPANRAERVKPVAPAN